MNEFVTECFLTHTVLFRRHILMSFAWLKTIERLHNTSCTPFNIASDIHSCLFHTVTGIDAEDMVSSKAVQLIHVIVSRISSVKPLL